MSLSLKNLDKNNLHHAYLLEGDKELILPEVLDFLNGLKIRTPNSSDLCHIAVDSFKIDDALNLKAMSVEKGMTDGKRIFIISSNSFSLDAQHALLKLFEEPIQNTHFFVITPDSDALIKTFVSRFYLISDRQDLAESGKDAKNFIDMNVHQRIEFIKNLLIEPEDEIMDESIRRKSLRFLNELEKVLHEKFIESKLYTKENFNFFNHVFKAREYLRQPGSSAKSLMESVALSIPVL